MINQRNSVGVDIGGRGRTGLGELDGNAHWVGEWGDRSVEIDTRCVQGVEEVNEPVVNEFLKVKDELTNCSWNFSRVIPPENVDNGTLIDGVIRINHLRGGKSK